jgi:hypothetical protein
MTEGLSVLVLYNTNLRICRGPFRKRTRRARPGRAFYPPALASRIARPAWEPHEVTGIPPRAASGWS